MFTVASRDGWGGDFFLFSFSPWKTLEEIFIAAACATGTCPWLPATLQ